MKEKFKLTTLERAWIAYDIGNSAFTLLVSTLLPIYFNALAEAAGLSSTQYLAYWGYAGSVATLLVAFIGPVFGAMADRKNYKKPIFTASLVLGVASCCLMGTMQSWLAFLVIFVIARVGYSSSLVFYDAMLPEVTNSQRMDRISSMGYAYGYIGSVIPFVACLVVVLMYESFGIDQMTAMLIAMVLTAAWWAVLSLPLLKHYRQTAFAEHRGNPVTDTFRRLGTTLKSIRKEKHVFLYLLAFFFFIDGVYTIIDMATAYGTALGLDTTGLLLALLLTQIVAFPCAIIFGRLAAKYDTGKLIKVCILAYTGITVFAIFLKVQWQFWVLAVLVGMFQGGIQALSRSYLGKIIDPERSGEYYGIMDICGKGASFVGMTMVSAVTQFTGHESVGVGTLVVLFIIGYVIFDRADKLVHSRRV